MASYPGSIKVFTTKRNIIDPVDAGHPNTLQDEVVALQTSIGLNPHVSTAGGGSTLGAWSSASRTYASMVDRLANIEAGLLSINNGSVKPGDNSTITGLKTFSPGLIAGDAAAGRNADVVIAGGASGGGRALIDLQTGGSSRWQLLKNQVSAELFLRDTVNARDHVVYTPGATAEAALTAFSSRVTTVGNRVAMDAQGTLAARPAASSANLGLFYTVDDAADTANHLVTFRSTGAAWVRFPLTAAQLSSVAVGGVAATNVQAAIEELDAEKSATGHTHPPATVTKTVRVPHTWAISGEVKVASGDTDFILPFFLPEPTGQTVRIVGARYRINTGTSVSVELSKDGTGVPGFPVPMSVTTTPTTSIATTPVEVTDGQALSLIVTAVSGTPKNMTFTVFLDYTV